MKTALVCIACLEDNYIDEWIKYHSKLGFDEIFIYQNDWRYVGNKCQFNNVHWIEFDGEAKQLAAYNDFICKYWNKYDFGAVFDVDEFLCLKKHDDVKSFLAEYTKYNAIGINWRFFGNNGLECIKNGNYSVLSRFIKCQRTLDIDVKSIINFKLSKNMPRFVHAHHVDLVISNDYMINVKKTNYIHSCRNYDFDDIAQLNHYNVKTKEEYISTKMKRGVADHNRNDPQWKYTIDSFNRHNYNDVEDTTARDFYHSCAEKAAGSSARLRVRERN